MGRSAPFWRIGSMPLAAPHLAISSSRHHGTFSPSGFPAPAFRFPNSAFFPYTDKPWLMLADPAGS